MKGRSGALGPESCSASEVAPTTARGGRRRVPCWRGRQRGGTGSVMARRGVACKTRQHRQSTDGLAAVRAHLRCRSKATVRHGRSSSACSISTAVPASTSAGSSTTNSEVRGGLFQARNCRDSGIRGEPGGHVGAHPGRRASGGDKARIGHLMRCCWPGAVVALCTVTQGPKHPICFFPSLGPLLLLC